MDIFPDVKIVPPLPHEKVLRLAVARIQFAYKPGWLYFKCKEQGLLEIFHRYQRKGYFEILESGEINTSQPPRLTVELVPRSCWFENVRSNVSAEQWNELKKRTSQKANRNCEVCGGRGPQWPVECHEIWQYNDINHIQKLEGLTALCPSCHEVKHIGLTQLKGKEVEATAHLAIVNGWSYFTAEQYVEQAFEVWEQRSKYAWTLDISWLESLGVPLRRTDDSDSSNEEGQHSIEEVTIAPIESEYDPPITISFWKRIFSMFVGNKVY